MADFPIVGIGSSAGRLEALQHLFRAMPPDAGLAFVIAAHLDPIRGSHLSELLGGCTGRPDQSTIRARVLGCSTGEEAFGEQWRQVAG
jgi:hypothetical protein